MNDKDNETRGVSKIRQQIEYNAKTNMALKERERRIDAKRETLKQEIEEVRQNRRAHPVEQDDGNIRVTIYIPRFLRNIILVNWFVWFGVFPALAALASDQPGNIIYVPVLLLLSLIALGITFAAWYLYWWLVAIAFTLAVAIVIIGLFIGAVEFSQIRETLDQAVRSR